MMAPNNCSDHLAGGEFQRARPQAWSGSTPFLQPGGILPVLAL